MQLDVRGAKSADAEELFITVSPSAGQSIAEQAAEVFGKIREILKSRGAWILMERIFAPESTANQVAAVRTKVYGELDDRVVPTWLVGNGHGENLAAVQVHAVVCSKKPKLLECEGSLYARTFEVGGAKWIVGTGLTAPLAGDEGAQTRKCFEMAESLLKQCGATLCDVGRTWLFLNNILGWYDVLNKVRTQFFLERGVLGPNLENKMPASTGIGVRPINSRAKLALDFFAVVGKDQVINRHHAAGKQKSALEYGSAFARSSTVKTPAGHIGFVSGTAAIDTEGNTCFLDDNFKQVQMTLDCVKAVFRDMNCQSSEVTNAIAYCKTQAVADVFHKEFAPKLPWPWVTVIGDVCRDNLLFEVEAQASIGSKKLM